MFRIAMVNILAYHAGDQGSIPVEDFSSSSSFVLDFLSILFHLCIL